MRITIGSQVPVTSQFLSNPLSDAPSRLEGMAAPPHPWCCSSSAWPPYPAGRPVDGPSWPVPRAQIPGRPVQVRSQAAERRHPCTPLRAPPDPAAAGGAPRCVSRGAGSPAAPPACGAHSLPGATEKTLPEIHSPDSPSWPSSLSIWARKLSPPSSLTAQPPRSQARRGSWAARARDTAGLSHTTAHPTLSTPAACV